MRFQQNLSWGTDTTEWFMLWSTILSNCTGTSEGRTWGDVWEVARADYSLLLWSTRASGAEKWLRYLCTFPTKPCSLWFIVHTEVHFGVLLSSMMFFWGVTILRVFRGICWKTSSFCVTVVLSLKKPTALTTRCGFSWQILVPPGPHAKIQMWLCLLSVAHSCCVSSLAPEPPGNTYSSIPRKTECLCHQGFWGLQKPPGLLGEKVRIKEKKTPLLPRIRKIALAVHLTTTIKSRAIKRCIKYMPFLHPFLSSLQNTTSFLLYFSPFKSHLSLNGGE